MSNVVSEVVDRGFCSGCGVCAGVCPSGALSMETRANGDLAPRADDNACLAKCRLCIGVCPFSSGVHNPRDRNEQLFRGEAGAIHHEDIGWHLCSVVGFRSDEALRKASASGGLATWCIEQLLSQRMVTRVAVVRRAEQNELGFFEFRAVSTVAELRQASGSIYHPVEISRIIKEITRDDNERWAIVGVPCLCAAVRNSRRLDEKVPFVFGLACGMYQNTLYTEMLLAHGGVDRHRVVDIQFRRKADDIPAWDYHFRGSDHRGVGREIAYQGLPYYLGRNAFFRFNACNFCMDVFAETADACFMDAWLPRYRGDFRGTSLVVVRSGVVQRLLQRGAIAGEIAIDEVGPDTTVASQRGSVRRKRELIFMRRGISAPGDIRAVKPTIGERIDWWLQRHAQERSKLAWLYLGRRFGQPLFWLAVADLVLLQCLARTVRRAWALSKKVARKFGKRLTDET